SYITSQHKSFTIHIPIFFLTIQLPPRSTLFPYTTLFRSLAHNLGNLLLLGKIGVFHNRRNASSRLLLLISKHLILKNTNLSKQQDRKSGSAGMPRPISYAVFCLKKKNKNRKYKKRN